MNPSRNNLSLLLCMILLGLTSPSFAERADRSKPLRLEANSVIVDDANQIHTFAGNVQLLQGTLSIQAEKIVVTQDKEGFQHCTATGQLAHFRQKRDGADEYVEGYGERIEYDTHSEIANFFGQARIKREGDDVRGEHIVYSTKTEVFQVNGTHEESKNPGDAGRVTLIIQPKSKTAGAVHDSASGVAASGVISGETPAPLIPATTTTNPKQ